MSFVNLPSFRFLALSVSLSFGVVSVAPAAPSTPQQIIAQAEADLAAANARVDQARAVLDRTNGALSSLSSRLNDTRQQANQIQRRMLAGAAALPEMQAAIDGATARIDARRREMAVEDTRYAPLKDAYEQAKLNAIKDFDASPEMRSALQAVNDMAAALGNVQSESLRRFSTTDEFRQALEASQSAGARVNDARQKFPSNSPEVAAAGRDAADAHARLDALRDHRLAIDPNVQIAQSKLSAAKTLMDDIRRRFVEQQLPQDPKVAAAEQPLKVEQANYDALAAAANAAEKQLADAQAALKRQNDGLAGDRSAADQLAAEITRMAAELPGAQADVTKASDDVDRAVAYANVSQQSRDNVIASLQPQNSGPVIYPPSSYSYNSPPVVYGQPTTIYVPSPYYGYGVYGPVIVRSGGPVFVGGYRGAAYGHGFSHGHSHGGHR